MRTLVPQNKKKMREADGIKEESKICGDEGAEHEHQMMHGQCMQIRLPSQKGYVRCVGDRSGDVHAGLIQRDSCRGFGISSIYSDHVKFSAIQSRCQMRRLKCARMFEFTDRSWAFLGVLNVSMTNVGDVSGNVCDITAIDGWGGGKRFIRSTRVISRLGTIRSSHVLMETMRPSMETDVHFMSMNVNGKIHGVNASMVAIAHANGMEVCDLETSRGLFHMEEKDVSDAEFMLDPALLMSCSPTGVRIWDCRSTERHVIGCMGTDSSRGTMGTSVLSIDDCANRVTVRDMSHSSEMVRSIDLRTGRTFAFETFDVVNAQDDFVRISKSKYIRDVYVRVC